MIHFARYQVTNKIKKCEKYQFNQLTFNSGLLQSIKSNKFKKHDLWFAIFMNHFYTNNFVLFDIFHTYIFRLNLTKRK